MDTTPISQSTDAKSDSSLFSYKRSNHFTEWINAAQGLENTQIPKELLDKICAYIEKHRIPDSRITVKKIRLILKVLSARKYYEHSTLIWSKVTGKTPKRFTARQEETLKNMFASIQEVRAFVGCVYVWQPGETANDGPWRGCNLVLPGETANAGPWRVATSVPPLTPLQPFERHCPPDRKNFLSYSYVLFKMCEILALDEFLPQFSS